MHLLEGPESTAVAQPDDESETRCGTDDGSVKQRAQRVIFTNGMLFKSAAGRRGRIDVRCKE